MVAAAIRSSYARAASTGKPQRVVFDFELRRVWLEEATGQMLAVNGDVTQTGGADAATTAEKTAVEQADKLLKGPRPSKAMFSPVKQLGLDEDPTAKVQSPGRELGKNIYFREMNMPHQAAPARTGRAYLFVWPGGLTEQAYIQIAKGTTPTDKDTMTLFVHPLTGRVTVVAGAKTLVVPFSPEEGSGARRQGATMNPTVPARVPSDESQGARPLRGSGGSRAGLLGFTLIEVIIAVAILGLALTVILSAQVGLFSTGTYGQHITEAMGLGRCRMSELEAQLLQFGYPDVDTLDERRMAAAKTRVPTFRCAWRIDHIELPTPGAAGKRSARR